MDRKAQRFAGLAAAALLFAAAFTLALRYGAPSAQAAHGPIVAGPLAHRAH